MRNISVWQERHKHTLASGAAALGISRASYSKYLHMSPKLVPRTVTLACAALDEGLEPIGAGAAMTADSDFLVPGGRVQAPTAEVMGRIERRWEGLRERVEATLQTLKGVDRRQESRLLDQAAKAGTVAKRVTWLRKAADSVTGSAAPLAACRKGCSHCCHIAVMISRAEALVIAKETGAPMNPLAGKFTMANVDEDSESYKAATQEAFGKPCTFLKDDGCGIYSSRPFQCRLLLNMDEDSVAVPARGGRRHQCSLPEHPGTPRRCGCHPWGSSGLRRHQKLVPEDCATVSQSVQLSHLLLLY